MNYDSTVAGTDIATRGGRRRARTRQKLTDAAAALIAEKGVAGLRIQEITEGADVALGSFYNHFESKEELVQAVVADTIAGRAATIVAEMAQIDDPAEVVAFACRRVIRIASDDPELAWLFVHLDRADVLFEGMVHQAATATFERGVTEGRFAIDDVHLAVTAATGAALAVMRAVLEARYDAAADEQFAEGVLRSLGLGRAEARAVAGRALERATR
jgi:AcrR family transcriptional regulator